jgi:hypothetical protein
MLVYKSYKDRRLRMSLNKESNSWRVQTYVEDELLPATADQEFASQAEALKAGMEAAVAAIDAMTGS